MRSSFALRLDSPPASRGGPPRGASAYSNSGSGASLANHPADANQLLLAAQRLRRFALRRLPRIVPGAKSKLR